RRPAKDAHTATAIELQLHARVRHFVVVDWSLRSSHVRTARDPDSLSGRQLSELVLPARARNNFIDTLAQGKRADANPVRRYRVGRNRVLLAHLCRVEAQVVGNLVHLDLLSPTWLRSSMPALRTARRF